MRLGKRGVRMRSSHRDHSNCNDESQSQYGRQSSTIHDQKSNSTSNAAILYLEMGWEGSRGLPGEIDPGEEVPEDLSLDLYRAFSAAAAELLDQLRELGAAALQILLR